MVFFLFLLGISVGSFLNALAERFSRNESILGRSYCEFCKAELKWKDLIPLLSFFCLRRKCRYCRVPLSFQYPFVEIITGLLFVFAYIHIVSGGIFPADSFQSGSRFGGDNDLQSLILNLVYSLFIVSIMIVVFITDFKYKIILDKIIFPAIVVSLIWIVTSNQQLAISHLLSALGSFLFFLFIYLITRGKGIGFGDVKFSFLIGLILGFWGTVLALYVAFLTGGLLGIILIIWKKKRLKTAIPFGPLLVLGFLISFFFSNQLNQLFFTLR